MPGTPGSLTGTFIRLLTGAWTGPSIAAYVILSSRSRVRVAVGALSKILVRVLDASWSWGVIIGDGHCPAKGARKCWLTCRSAGLLRQPVYAMTTLAEQVPGLTTPAGSSRRQLPGATYLRDARARRLAS